MDKTKKSRKNFIFFLFFLIGAFFFFSDGHKVWAEGNITVNVSVANTTDEKNEKVPIRQDLPEEVKKEDVIDTGGMTLKYDEERSIYYLYAESDLQPKATKLFKVTLHDLWAVSDGVIDFLKEQTDQRLESLKGKESYTAGQALRNSLISQIDEIKSSQDAQKSDIQKRIDLYRVHTQKIDEIRQKITLLEEFTKEAKRFSESQKENKFINFVIEADNSSNTDPVEKMEITRYLPQGIQPSQIADLKGFEIKFDPEKNLYYLTNTIDLKGGEVKKFSIPIISESLIIPESKLEEVQATDSFTSKLVDTGYQKLGAYLVLEIKKYAEEIKNSQKNAISPEDKVAVYTVNLKKMEEIKKNIEKLRKLVEAAEKAKAKKLSEIIKTVTPDVATTWKIIYATIGFLAVISIFFYFLWWGQAKAKQNQKLEVVNTGGKEK